MGIQINGQTDTISAFDNNFSLAGNVSIGGTLTYEDVTSVDAVGLSTFQAGIRVTGGDVRIGTTNNVTFGSRRALTVANGVTGAVISLYNNTTATANPRISSNPGGSEINDIGIHAASTNGSIIAYTNNDTERLRITAAGNLGINDTSPENSLSIKNIGSFEGDANSFYLGSNFTGTGQNFSGSGKHAQRFFFNNASSNGYLKYENTGTTGNAGAAITWQERFRITSAGLVGIGTENPTETLTLNHANGASIGLEYSGTENGTINVNSAAMYVRAGTGKHLILGSNGTEKLRIASNGQIGMGKAGAVTVNGNSPLTIQESDSNTETICLRATNSGGNGSQPGIVMKTAAGGHIGGIYCDVNSDYMRLSTSGTDRMIITNTGSVGVNIASPAGNFEVNGNDGINISNATRTGTNGAQWRLIPHNGGGSATNLRLYEGAGATEVLNITKTGNIGVNQTSVNSSRKMEITQPSSYTSGLRINSAGSAGNGAYVEFFVGTANYKIGGDHNTNALLFKKDGTEYMRHDSSGHLQIRREGIGNFSGTDSRHTRYIIKQTNGQEAIAGSVFAQGKSNWGGHLVFATKQSNGNPSTGLTERMRLNADGQLTIPQQPTFNAKLSAATSAGFTGILVFNNVDYNIGSHYNNSNGKFTAPIDGRYLFAWYTNVERTSGNGSVWGDWYVNGSPRNNRFYTHHSGAWELIGGTIILDLNANDYLQVYVGVGGKYDGSSYGSFSGTLLG